MREDLLDRTELLGFVVNHEVPLVAQFVNVLAQNTDTQGMECANGWPLLASPVVGARWSLGSRAALASGFGTLDYLAHPLLHFAGGFVGKGHSQDMRGRDLALNQVSDTISNH